MRLVLPPAWMLVPPAPPTQGRHPVLQALTTIRFRALLRGARAAHQEAWQPASRMTPAW